MSALASHYQQENLNDKIKQALEQVIAGNTNFDPNIIAAVDQFHIGGLQATNDMLAIAQFAAGDVILDIGCGIGGPVRNIAKQSGSRVIGLDLSYDYCLAADLISTQFNMARQTGFVQANAIHLPFSDNSFDGIWTQHVTMNIDRKNLLMKEFARTLKPAAKLLMYEVTGFQNSNHQKTTQIKSETPLHYPLPWSVDGAYSFVQPQSIYRDLIESNGLHIDHFSDVTSQALNSVKNLLTRLQKNKLQKPDLSLLLGNHFSDMMLNLAQALDNEVLSVYRIMAHKTNTID